MNLRDKIIHRLKLNNCVLCVFDDLVKRGETVEVL